MWLSAVAAPSPSRVTLLNPAAALASTTRFPAPPREPAAAKVRWAPQAACAVPRRSLTARSPTPRRHRLVYRLDVRGGYNRHVVFERGRRSAVEYRGNLQQSRHASGATAHADPSGPLPAATIKRRHQMQSDCGLLRRYAGLFDPEQQWNAVPAQLQSLAGAQRSGQRGRNDYPAGTDRQQLHAQWRRFRDNTGGRFDGLAPTQFQLNQRRRSHCASGFRRSERQRRDSGIRHAPGQRHTGCCASGISSTSGKGENGSINLVVAKSGRTTGLTCASISAMNLDVEVDYYTNCAETDPYLTKTYTNQLAIEGNQFSDAGDSGSLVVDVSNAEPVGLFFAGRRSRVGRERGCRKSCAHRLVGTGYAGGDHLHVCGHNGPSWICLNYGNGTATAAQARTLSGAQTELAQQSLAQARILVNPSAGILGAATGKSNDHAGEAAVILYVDQSMNVAVPQTIAGARTAVIPTTPRLWPQVRRRNRRRNPTFSRLWLPRYSTRPSRPSSRWRRP